MIATKNPGRGKAWRIASAVASLGLFAWGLAALAYFDTKGASAEDTETFRDVDLVFDVYQGGEWYTVSISFFMFDSGDGTFDQQAEAAKAAMLARFPGAAQPADDHVTAAYVLSGFWWTSGQAGWAYNADGEPLSAHAALQAAASTWGQQGGNFAFTGGGTTGAGTGACGGGTDGQNTVGWGAQGGSVLAVTCSWFQSQGNPRPAVEFDMEIDPDWNWSTGSPIQVDLQSVALHEFGHALGLNHSGQGSAVMYASYSNGSNKRTPTQDDKDGLIAIYGGQGQPTSTPTNTPQATATPTKTPTPGSGGQSPTPPLPTSTPTKTPTQPGGGGSQPTPPLPTSTPTKTPTQPGGAGGQPTPPLPTSTPTTPASPTATPSPTVSASATPTKTPTPGNSLPVLPGANLFAWPGNDAPPSVALSGVANLKIVYSYDPLTGDWKRYVPGAPGYLNNLPILKKGGAYWFIATGSAQVPFE